MFLVVSGSGLIKVDAYLPVDVCGRVEIGKQKCDDDVVFYV